MAANKKNKQSTQVSYRQETFEYEAVTSSGARSKGKMQATSRESVVTALQTAGYMPLNIKKVSSTNWGSDITAILGSKYQSKVFLSVEEQARMFRQIAELLRAGVSVNYIIQALGEEAPKKLKPVYEGLLERLNAGVPFSEALKSFGGAFDKTSHAYIESGEVAGTLGETMDLLAKSMERRAAVKSKIKGVTAYPKMVSMAIGGIVVLIMKLMVPKYTEIYADMKSELPAPTRLLVKASDRLLPVTSEITFPTPFFLADNIEWGLLAFPVRIAFFCRSPDAFRDYATKSRKRVYNCKNNFKSYDPANANPFRGQLQPIYPVSTTVLGVYRCNSWLQVYNHIRDSK